MNGFRWVISPDCKHCQGRVKGLARTMRMDDPCRGCESLCTPIPEKPAPVEPRMKSDRPSKPKYIRKTNAEDIEKRNRMIISLHIEGFRSEIIARKTGLRQETVNRHIREWKAAQNKMSARAE